MFFLSVTTVTEGNRQDFYYSNWEIQHNAFAFFDAYVLFSRVRGFTMKQRRDKAGKHRRNEIYKALEMKDALKKDRIIIALFICIGVSTTMLPFVVPFETLFPAANTTIQSILTAVTFLALMFVSMRMYKYVEKNQKYKDYCSKAHITKSDEQALKQGIL